MDVPVLVKNPVSPDLELWIGAIERIYNAGIRRIGAIHRGFSSIDKNLYRNHPLWAVPIELHRRIPALPIFCDPSHIGGKRELIAPLSQQAMDLGFGGLIVESHCKPDCAWSDKAQQVTPDALAYIIRNLVIRDQTITTESLTELRSQIDKLDDELLELLTRGEWGFCGHNVTDYMDYPEYRYTNLMVRTGNELPLGGPNKLIGKGKGGNSSSTEGTWSEELNTVLVAADTASAEAADAARRAGEDASTYETVPSATQYFAVRKAAQRVLYSNANSNAILNGYENHIVEELEYKVGDKFGGWGGGKNIITPLFTARYADVSDIKIVNADAIPGMNLGADGVASGTFNEAGDYTVTATATVEGWVYVQLTLTIHVK